MTPAHEPQADSLPNNIENMTAAECLAWFEEMDFRDPLEHPLTHNTDFLHLVSLLNP